MIANLFLHKATFEYNGADSQEQVKDKLRAFADDMRGVVFGNNGENVFCVSNDVLKCEVYSGVSLIDSVALFLDGDRQGVMYSILANTADQHDRCIEELKRMAQYKIDEEVVTSIVYLNKPKSERILSPYIQFDYYEVVYDKSSWITLRRQILGNHPGVPSSFIRECRKYFPDLAIHNHCVDSLQDDHYQYLSIIPRKIVYYLSCLNDGFRVIRDRHMNNAPDANSVLSDFSGCFGLDEAGSIERNPNKKGLLTFEFKKSECGLNETSDISVLCEPHLKISHPDSTHACVDSKTFHPRIYFNFGDEKVEDGKILVGSIGTHI